MKLCTCGTRLVDHAACEIFIDSQWNFAATIQPEHKGQDTMIANAILSVMATGGPLGPGDIRRMLSHFSYAGLRYRLARLQEDGEIERVGDAYRLRQKVDLQE